MKSIVLNEHEVRGLLSGSVTKLAREIKPQPEFVWGQGIHSDGVFRVHVRYPGCHQPDPFIKCPFQPGEVRWVKEKHAFLDQYRSNLKDHWKVRIEFSDGSDDWHDTPTDDAVKLTREPGEYQWRSSAIMPQWASRLNIKFGPTRAVMLGDLTEADVEALGFCQWQSIETGQKSTALQMLQWYRYKVLKKQWGGSLWIWLTDVEVVR